MADHTHRQDKEYCRTLLKQLSLYIDGEAEQAICEDIERHMAECEDCRIVIDTLTRTVRLYRDHGHTRLPGDARRRLYTALDISDFLDED